MLAGYDFDRYEKIANINCNYMNHDDAMEQILRIARKKIKIRKIRDETMNNERTSAR